MSYGCTEYGNFAVEVSHVYNSIFKILFANKIVGVGNGWKLNLHQRLVQSGNDVVVSSKAYYYDPETGLCLNAAPMESIADKAFVPKGIDRNAPLCNNILELAGNPFTVETTVELTADGTYDVLDDLKAINQNGKPVYTGITRQSIKKRLSQHIRKGKPFVKAQSVVENLTRNQARAIETYKILYDGCSGENLILSISRNHRFYDDAIRWAKIFLGE